MQDRLWKVLLIPVLLILLFGLIGLLYPSPYMDFYLRRSAQSSVDGLRASDPQLSAILQIIFRANGLGMTMSAILALFIICIPFRKHEKWATAALLVPGGIGFIGEVVLEIAVLSIK